MKFIILIAVLIISFVIGEVDNVIAFEKNYNLKDHGILIEDIGGDKFLLVINLGNEEEPAWYSITPNGSDNKKLGYCQTCMHTISDVRVSPDKRYIAIVSVGEGHPHLHVINLPLLLSEKKYKVIDEIDPYPGSISIIRWNKKSLIIESQMLLNYRNVESNRIPDCLTTLMFSHFQRFSLSPETGRLTPLTETATNPEEYFRKGLIENLSSRNDSERQDAACALALLKDYYVITDLKEALKRESSPEVKIVIEKAIEDLDSIRQNK